MPAARAAREAQIVDAVLTSVARRFTPYGFVGQQLCPTVPVDLLSGLYPVFDDSFWFGTPEGGNKLSDRAETPEVDFAWSTEPYLCEDYGLKVSITPRERSQAHRVLRLEAQKTEFLMGQMALLREQRIAAMLRKTSNGGQLTGGAAATSPFATSTAIETDFKASKLAVYSLTGLSPNVAVIPYAVAYDMATNATLREIFKYTVNHDAYIKLGADQGGEDIFLPRWFQGCRLVVPKGTLRNTAREGAAKSLTDIWGSSVRFLHVAENPGWGIPSVAYQFQHSVITGMGRAGENGPVIDRWHENDPVKDLIRAVECVDERVCAPDLGFELSGV